VVAFFNGICQARSSVSYGFGWMLRTDSMMGRVVYYFGYNPGYKTTIVHQTDRNHTIILLCNIASRAFTGLLKEMELNLKKLKRNS
jgi:hypothetical protein